MAQMTAESMDPGSLPHFERPPVIETVLGVQFDPLSKFRNAHLGAFWKRLGNEWPNVNDAPPILPQFERFDDAGTWGEVGFHLKLAEDLNVRIQIRNAAGNRMIQVQNGRFHYNWLGADGGKYPQYTEVRPGFDGVWGEFQRFLADESLGEIRPNQWEVTYVNHIPKGPLWESPADWARLFRSPTTLPTSITSANLESFGGEWHYEIRPQLGRLHVQIQHARLSSPTSPEVLRLTLTARGPIRETESERLSLDEGLNFGRSTVVRTFKELTSDEAHSYWGLTREHA